MGEEVVIIDVQAQFTDKMTQGMNKATDASDKLDKSLEKTEKQINKIDKKDPTVEIKAKDKASTVIKKVNDSAAKISRQKYTALIGAKDAASDVIGKVKAGVAGFAGKTFKGTMTMIDKVTSPLRTIKNALFNIQTLISTVAAGFAFKMYVMDAITLADSITSAQIGFETMLGSAEKAGAFMNKVKQFAVETPFETMDVVQNAQKMMVMGWTEDTVLGDMKKIGNAASALGKGSEGIDRIVTALGQMQMKGKVSAEEMLQLTEGGVAAWKYLAQGVGVSVADVQEIVRKGDIDVGTAIGHIMDGLSEFDGLMDKTANRTVSGLWSQIKDTFTVGIFEKWGKGLQKGVLTGMENFLGFLNKIDPLITDLGKELEKIGSALSGKFSGVLDGILDRADTVLNSEEFQNASGMDKIKIAWTKIIWDPFKEWWDNTMLPKIKEKAGGVGEAVGKGLTTGILAILGVDVSNATEDGATIGSSFAEGFIKGFDSEAVGKALKDAVGGVLSSAGDVLPGGKEPTATSYLAAGATLYGGAKLAQGAGGFLKGAAGLKNFLFGTAATGTTAATSGIVGTASTATGTLTGSGLMYGAANMGTALGSTAYTGAGLAAAGTAGTAGYLAGLAGVVSGAIDIVKAVKNNDEGKAWSGGTKLGMVGTGAGIGAIVGSVVPGLGTGIGAGIGAGIGGIGALIGGSKFGSWLQEKSKTEVGGGIMGGMAGAGIGTLALGPLGSIIGGPIGMLMGSGKWDEVKAFFTDTIPEALDNVKEKGIELFTETIPEKWHEFWQGVGDFFTETLPTAIGYAAGVTLAFFTVTIPEKWNEFWEGVGEFFTETLPEALAIAGAAIGYFLTVTVPEKWNEFWEGVGEFFTETLPEALETVGAALGVFFLETIPAKWDEFWTSVGEFFTETIPNAAEAVGKSIKTFFTETIPAKVGDFFSSAADWFGNVKAGFTSGYDSQAKKHANGGFMTTPHLGLVAEDGPEVIIPVGADKRNRGKSLWQQAGSLLGVKAYADGGIAGSTSGLSTGNGMSVQIGSITIQLNGDGSGSIVDQLKAQEREVAETISEIVSKALSDAYENMPIATT